tara:strand:+ start:582 stop:935 length:354 start_codon:yes stop_codon:yes gene_type:complete
MALNELKNNFEKEPDYQEWLKLHRIKETWDYDYKAAFEADIVPDDDGKWPSRFKHDLSPERYVSTNDGWLDTKETDLKGADTFVPWTQVMTHEMNRSEKGDFNISDMGEPVSIGGEQ